MPTSPRYGFDYLESGETVPSDAVNEMVERIEAGGGHFIFKDRITDPSALTPAAGDTYLIDGTGAGDWTGHNNVIAYYLNTAWIYFTPIEGFTAWVNDVNEFIGFNGTTWDVIASPSGSYLPTTAVLDDLADVDAPTPADGDVLTWDDGASEWVAAAAAGGASTTQTEEQISGFIASPSNKDYRIVVKMAHAGTITETTTISASGTCTATFKINTTALGGTANSVSSAEQSQSHASNNTFSAGDDIVLTVSSNSSCTDMSFTIKYTRTLA